MTATWNYWRQHILSTSNKLVGNPLYVGGFFQVSWTSKADWLSPPLLSFLPDSCSSAHLFQGWFVEHDDTFKGYEHVPICIYYSSEQKLEWNSFLGKHQRQLQPNTVANFPIAGLNHIQPVWIANLYGGWLKLWVQGKEVQHMTDRTFCLGETLFIKKLTIKAYFLSLYSPKLVRGNQ